MRGVVLQHPLPTGASNQNGAFGFVRKQGIVFDPAIAECSLLRRGFSELRVGRSAAILTPPAFAQPGETAIITTVTTNSARLLLNTTALLLP